VRSRLFRWRISRLERGHRIDLLKSRLERRRNREEGLVILAALGRLVPALNWWQRDRALDALTACVARTDVASGALEILLAIAAESPDDSLRERVAEELAEALHRVFDDARIPVVRALGEVTRSLKDEWMAQNLMQPLADLLEDEHLGTRRAAAQALAQADWRPKDQEQLARMRCNAGDAEGCVALGRAALTPLLENLECSHEDLRLQAATALRELAAQLPQDELSTTLDDAMALLGRAGLRVSAARFLALAGARVRLAGRDLDVVNALITNLSASFHSERKAAAEALRDLYQGNHLGPEAAARVLEQRERMAQPHTHGAVCDEYERWERGRGWYTVTTAEAWDVGIGVDLMGTTADTGETEHEPR
jgi:hypothetical protein